MITNQCCTGFTHMVKPVQMSENLAVQQSHRPVHQFAFYQRNPRYWGFFLPSRPQSRSITCILLLAGDFVPLISSRNHFQSAMLSQYSLFLKEENRLIIEQSRLCAKTSPAYPFFIQSKPQIIFHLLKTHKFFCQ